MKHIFFTIFFFNFYLSVFAQNEVKPDGDKLIWIFLVILLVAISFFIFRKSNNKNVSSVKNPFLQFKRVEIQIEKDRLYYPDNLKLTVKNSGNTDLDLDRPLFILDNFWLKRKFKLKGMGNRIFYPLYLEKGKTHTLQIDLNRFYSHDKSLKKFPKAKVSIFDVKGKRLGSKSVYLRKTLFKF
ncbi:MAG: hypothetical protein L3J11_04810 [Draconibacterium sp.]|nr:hypothetical protein [Draconibacterium sp.]